MYNLGIIIPLVIMAYLIGNISPSVIISKKFQNQDIRTQGSGNAGATNVMRVMGKKMGIIVFLLDLVKGAIPALLGIYFGGASLGLICGTVTVIGHIFPAFLKFKGGKGVATSLGVGLVVSPVYALIGFGVFFIVVIGTKYVSLGSILGVCTFPLLMFFTNDNISIRIFSTILGILVIYSHRENIKRLAKGQENKFGSKK